MDEVTSNESVKFKVDLENQQLSSAKGTLVKFELDTFRKENLLKGLDDIGLTLKIVEKIGSFEEKQKQSMPWLWA